MLFSHAALNQLPWSSFDQFEKRVDKFSGNGSLDYEMYLKELVVLSLSFPHFSVNILTVNSHL